VRLPSASIVFTRVYEQKPLTSAVLEVLNAEVSGEDLKSDLEQSVIATAQSKQALQPMAIGTLT
jgi:hypothetical protein